MDLHEHAQLIYANLLQARTAKHSSAPDTAEQRALAETALHAARIFQETAAGHARK